jgi:aromatic ring-opening dioxygenase catalytic subunit (LigB family)
MLAASDWLSRNHDARRMPVLFVSHGAPTLPFDDVPARRYLIELARKVPRLKMILCLSAHWEAATPSLNAAPQPGTVRDCLSLHYHIIIGHKGHCSLRSLNVIDGWK